MAYSTSNPPSKVGATLASGRNMWIYVSADVDSDVNATDYFSNGQDLGMKVGDIVFVVDTATPKTSFHYVSAIDADGNATTAFGAVA